VKKRTAINLLALLLVVLFEYIVIEWTRVYGSNDDVVSHVGFAGTIVSIVLAVIAIIYSYYQNFAQRRDSSLLGQQLENLRSVAEKLAREGADLTTVKDQIRQSFESMMRTERTVADLGVRLAATESAKAAQEVSNDVPRATEPPIGNREAVARLLIKRAGPSQQSIYLLICAASERRMSTREMGDFISAVVEKRLIAMGKQDIASVLGHWFDGILTGHVYMLASLGIASYVRIEGKDRWCLQPIPEFIQSMKETKLETVAPDALIDPGEVAAAIAALG